MTAQSLADAVVDTIGTAILVLDEDLRVVSANRSFCEVFNLARHEVEGHHIHTIGGAEWDSPALLVELKAIIPGHRRLVDYRMDRDFVGIGRRTIRLDAHEIILDFQNPTAMLLCISDVSEMQSRETKMIDLLQKQELLLEEMSHRIGDSLILLASILMIDARTTQDNEVRSALEDAHRRVMSVAAVQKQSRTLTPSETIAFDRYLSDLCAHLLCSMSDDHSKISLKVQISDCKASADHAVYLGLIVTELVSDALKYAFPDEKRSGQIAVSYESSPRGWILVVSDDGVSRSATDRPGAGLVIVDALVRQVGAQLAVSIGPLGGRSIAITHATVMPLPKVVEDAPVSQAVNARAIKLQALN